AESRPESITVQVLNGQEVVQEQEVTANGDNEWNYTFTDLPKFDKAGKEITYTVAEKEVPEGYEVTEKDNNLINLRVGTTEVDITKLWKDEQETDRPDTIKVNLLQNGEFYEEYEVTEENDWKLTITDLPEFDEEGVAYEYTVKEHDVPGYAADVDVFDITNTRTDVKTIELSKTWLDNDDATGDRPGSIEVELYRSIADGDNELVETYTLTSEADWKLVVEDLPSFDDNGKAYTYEIEEVEVGGYETTINGFDITNLRVGTVDVAGEKTWVEVDDQYRPDSITVNLLANDELEDSQVVTANDEGEWTFAFTDLAQFDEEGKEIEYTIEEEAVVGYTTEIVDFTITNTQYTTELSGTKTWLDNDDATGDRPESITVRVLNGEEVVQEQEVTANDDGEWIYTFTDLPEFDKEGKEITYTVEEIVPEGYEATVEGHDITNLRVGTVDVAGEKTWVEVDDQYRPDSITVNLLANDELEDSQVVTANDEGEWTFAFTDLAQFDEEGKEIEYTIEEEAVVGYTTEIVDFTITNTQDTTEL